MTNNAFLTHLSDVFGWIYFTAWSVSFYGQVIENYRRKHVRGLAFDYQVYNVFGFIGYCIYTIWGYIEPGIGTGKVRIQDIVFAIHAVILTLVTIGQCYYYYDKTDPSQHVSTFCKTVLICIGWGFFQIVLIERILKMYDPMGFKDAVFRYNTVIYLGFMKVLISFIKFFPQVIRNYRRKSTIGWNIHNILLDFTGGSFSLAQNIIDTILGSNDPDPTQNSALNFTKYALSIISMFFDLIFMFQHYVLYKERDDKVDEKYKNLVNDTETPPKIFV